MVELGFLRKIRDATRHSSKTGGDSIFSLSSAYITLDTKLGLVTTGKCAISIKATNGRYFYEMQQEIERFITGAKPDIDLQYRTVTDSYGYLWMVLEGKKIEDLLAGITSIDDTVKEKGFSDELLAVVFQFSSNRADSTGDKKYHLVYNYKRDNFYPFVSTGAKTRNTEEEMKIMAAIGEEVPFEKDMALWYPLWDLPL